MPSAYIHPFIDARLNVFSTMTQLELEIGQPERAEAIPTRPFLDVSGIVAMSGDIVGTVILGFPTKTAEAVASTFTGQTIGADHEDFADAIGELVNMVAGNAKAKFDGKRVSIGIPSVVIGNHQISLPSDAVCLTIPFKSPASPFAVELYLELSGKATSVARERIWQILAPHVARFDRRALLAAARLDYPKASNAVRKFLRGAEYR